MTKSKKFIAIILTMMLVTSVTFGITLAYLTSNDAVENVFTVGNVEISLDEADYDENGDIESADRVKTNTYKLIPGRNYGKEVQVHVKQGSEPCYVFIKIDNGIEAIESTYYTIEEQLCDQGWVPVDGVDGVYYQEGITDGVIDAGIRQIDLIVFEEFTIAKNVPNDTLKTYEDAKITIKAYAVQAEGFKSAKDAWTNAPTDWNF